MPLIFPSNTLSAGGFSVDNSCRFNDGDSPHMERTYGTSTDVDKCTMSVWVKRGALGGTKSIFGFHTDDNNRGSLVFEADQLDLIIRDSGSVTTRLVTTALYRDVSAWYHIVLSVDTGQGVAASRVRLYVNGSEVTVFGTETDPSQDLNFGFNNSSIVGKVGQKGENNDYFDGYMAEFVFIDGLQLTPSSFGEFNEDSPTIWQPIDVSGLTFGNNGYYLDFEDSADLGADVSGNSNDFTSTNLAATDQASDSPTNNFATFNPLDNYYASSTFSEGNCKVVQGSSTYAWNSSTIAVTAGKWYVEAKITTDSEHALVGITDAAPVGTGTKILGSGAYDYSIKFSNGDLFNNVGDDPSNDGATYAAAYAQNDIIGIALDCDNNKLYFSKGGAWSDGSGSWDSTTFNASVGAITITAPASTDNGHYFFASGDYGSASCTWEWNFGGCPPNTISSGNADDNGYGNFEYDVPDGYLALCTKNLGSDGG